VPAMPSSLLEPVFVQFEALLAPRAAVHPDHPLGCHRRRIPDRVVFELIVLALVYGCGYERVANRQCSDRTLRRRVRQWAKDGLAQQLHALALDAYDRIVGLDFDAVAVDGCITKAPCGGAKAGPSPVDRRKGGLKRSLATDTAGIPIGVVSAPANRHDLPLLEPTLDAATTQTGPWPPGVTVHLDAAYDAHKTQVLLTTRGLRYEITWHGEHPPVKFTRRWMVERTHSWMNAYGRLRRMTDKDGDIVDFYLHLAAAFVTTRALIRHARKTHRWPGRPTTRRLK
jgi:transposase